MQAANEQSKKITQLDQNIESLKRTATPNITTIRNQITAQQKIVHEGFDSMMHRLCQIEDGVNQAKKNADANIQINRQSEQSLNQLLRQIEKMEKEEGIPEYHGTRDQLYKEVQQFEKIIDQENERLKITVQSLQAGKKTTLQPLQTFQTKLAIHNKNNEEILKTKLRNFSDRLKKVEKKIEEATWSMNNESIKAKNQQKKIIEDMNNVQKQMNKIRHELELADERRRQEIQSSAATLDNMVEEMLSQTKKLQLRVDNLKKGYEEETEKMRSR